MTKEFREKLYGTILETHQMEREKRLQEASEKSKKQETKAQKNKPEQKKGKAKK